MRADRQPTVIEDAGRVVLTFQLDEQPIVPLEKFSDFWQGQCSDEVEMKGARSLPEDRGQGVAVQLKAARNSVCREVLQAARVTTICFLLMLMRIRPESLEIVWHPGHFPSLPPDVTRGEGTQAGGNLPGG
jgi:hypothetical protein